MDPSPIGAAPETSVYRPIQHDQDFQSPGFRLMQWEATTCWDYLTQKGLSARYESIKEALVLGQLGDLMCAPTLAAYRKLLDSPEYYTNDQRFLLNAAIGVLQKILHAEKRPEF